MCYTVFMTITLNNSPVTLAKVCVTTEGALFECGSVKGSWYVGRGGREDFFEEKYVPCCANCGEWLE
jgi:hypothetical protein